LHQTNHIIGKSLTQITDVAHRLPLHHAERFRTPEVRIQTGGGRPRFPSALIVFYCVYFSE